MRNATRIFHLLAIVLIGSIVSHHAYSANAASDNASDPNYTGGNFNGVNAGTGFGAWVVTANSTGNNSAFIGDSSTNGNGTSGNINSTGNKSWGLFANNANTESAVRPFTGGSLAIGQTFTIKLDNGFEQNGAVVGFGLQNASGANGFEFFFTGGNTAYTIAATGVSPSGTTAHGFTTDGLTAAFTLTGTTTFSLQLTWNTGNPSAETFTGSLENSVTTLDQFRIFDFNSGTTNNSGTPNNAYFNSVSVSAVPEPSSVALLGGPAILGAWFYIRRRRA